MLRHIVEGLSHPPARIAASLRAVARMGSTAVVACATAAGAFAASQAVDHVAPLFAAGNVVEVLTAELQGLALVALKVTALAGGVSAFLGL